MGFVLKVNYDLHKFKHYKHKNEYNSRYGDGWMLLSRELRERIRKCQWCDKKQRHLSQLTGHHIGCVKYNYAQLLDKRIIIIVCDSCHVMLEPYSKINLTQMIPQLFEA